jgi:hypothetical protein
MTRRGFLLAASVPGLAIGRQEATLSVPVRYILDKEVKWRPGQVERFRATIWSQTVRDLLRCGVRLAAVSVDGGVWRPAHRQPMITGLDRGAINLVLTNEIPLEWDHGRALCGVTTLYRGYHLCMIAVNRAHGHQLPFVSVNTCLHELLHALLHDIFELRPRGLPGAAREFRVDYYATQLWLFRGGDAIREAARSYVRRWRAEAV